MHVDRSQCAKKNHQRNTDSSVQRQKIVQFQISAPKLGLWMNHVDRYGSPWFIHNPCKWRPLVEITFRLCSKSSSPSLCNSEEVAGDVDVASPDAPALVTAMRLMRLIAMLLVRPTAMRWRIFPNSQVFFSVLCSKHIHTTVKKLC